MFWRKSPCKKLKLNWNCWLCTNDILKVERWTSEGHGGPVWHKVRVDFGRRQGSVKDTHLVNVYIGRVSAVRADAERVRARIVAGGVSGALRWRVQHAVYVHGAVGALVRQRVVIPRLVYIITKKAKKSSVYKQSNSRKVEHSYIQVQIDRSEKVVIIWIGVRSRRAAVRRRNHEHVWGVRN
jgi:hypothetical protein